tara:strand:+ start:904 stop:1140 length:237 start_codon:yes stop_codon:yes gene_type:complete
VTISASSEQVTITGIEPAISSINIGLADIQTLDMNLYVDSLTDISNGTDYTLSLIGSPPSEWADKIPAVTVWTTQYPI